MTSVSDAGDEERPAITPMAANRQAEFATARACARAALEALGVRAAVPRREGGAPLWPADATGSISHTKGFCLAVASIGTDAIGIDAELIHRMKPAVERRILVADERARLDGFEDHDRHERVATIFAAKEAFYKAHYEVDPRYIGFDAVNVTVDGLDVRFGPASGVVSPDLLDRTIGRVLVEDGRVIVGVRIASADDVGPLRSPA